MNTATEATPEQLVREIRREEAHIAQLRSRSAARRADLLNRLAKATGSASGAARALGVTPQAVSKALTAAREEAETWDSLMDASINAMHLRLAGDHHGIGWATDVATEEEWRAIEDPQARQEAATRAAEAWKLRANYTGALARFLHGLALGCEDAADAPEGEAETPQQVREITLGEVGERIPVDLLPANRGQARDVAALAEALAKGLERATSHLAARRWIERAGGGQG